MGVRNILTGVALKATPEIIQLRWKGYLLEAINSPARRWLPAAEIPVAFFVRPEYVRLVRKDRSGPLPITTCQPHGGAVVGAVDQGTSYNLHFLVEPAPGADPSPRRMAGTWRSRCPASSTRCSRSPGDPRWSITMHRGSIHVLPTA